MTTLRFALAALVTVAVAAPLGAPVAAQGACKIETQKPYALATAAIYIRKHDGLVGQDNRLEMIRQAVEVLTDKPDRSKNEAGRNYLLGQVYVRWFKDAAPRIVLRAKRGDLGFQENPDGEFYLPTALDEVMGIVEREQPACTDSTARYRNAVFLDVLNAAINFNNAKAYDSAIVYANHALLVNARSPQVGTAYQVISIASQAKGDLAGAASAQQKVIEQMGTDATTASSRASATFKLAVFTRDLALKESGEARSRGLRRSAELFKQYLELAPNGESAAQARAAYTRSLQEAGDSASVAGIHAAMIANPGAYTAIQLFEAAVIQANGQKLADAAVLYESGLQMNPWHRDALFNVANVYLALHQPEKMALVVERLRAVDPMNPDVVRLAGAVWQERGALSGADAKVRQMSQDSVLAYVDRASKLPARVTVSRFLVGRDNTVMLAGAVENLGAATASYGVLFDLLDTSGAVLGTAEVRADQVAAKGRSEFSVQIGVAGVVAWRYRMK